MNLRSLAPLLLLALAGCATTSEIPPAKAPPSAVLTGLIRVQPVFRADRGEWVATSTSVPLGSRIEQFLIPGALYGRSRGPEWGFDIRDEPFQVDIDTFVPYADRAARTLSYVSRGNGLRVVPAETRIARMGFVAPIWEGKVVQGATRIKPPNETGTDSPGGQLLVYFDRPCRMYGSYYYSWKERVEIDVTINAAGFSWLRWVYDKESGKRRIVSGDAFKEVALAVDRL